MKRRTKILTLSLVSLLALGGVATGLALTINAANKSDSALIDKDYIDLTWGDKGVFGNITELTSDHPVVKTITVKIDKAGDIGAHYYINYTFNATSDVKCQVFDKELTNTVDDTPVLTLDKSKSTGSVEINTTTDTYTNYVKFTIDASYSGTLDGTLDIELSNAPLNA